MENSAVKPAKLFPGFRKIQRSNIIFSFKCNKLNL